MKSLYLFAFIFLFSCTNKSVKETENWVSIFNGNNLDGWDVKLNHYPLNENYNNTFIVRDSMLVVNYSEYDSFQNEFGHIFYKEPFSHYKLRVEYRFTGDQVANGPEWAFRNSGIMFHCQSPESMLVEQEFPVCIEYQMLGGSEEGERSTGNLCTPGTDIEIEGERVTTHCITSNSPTYRGDQWVTAELVVYGDSIIHHIINGDTVMTYTKPQIGGDLPEGFPLPQGAPLKEGYFSLQAESHPVEFRKIELLNLKE
jgi:hypothetical protein